MQKVKKLKWWAWTLIAISMVIVLSVGLAMVYIFKIAPRAERDYIVGVENPHGFRYLGLRPEGAKKDYVLTGEENEVQIKQLATQLYIDAANSCKNTENLVVYNDCNSIFLLGSMKNYIDIDVVILKNQNQYFRIEYHLKNSIPIFDTLPSLEEDLNKMVEMVTTERYYYEKNMEYALYQKVLNNKYSENKVPYADWNDEIKEEHREVPIFHRQQQGIMELTQHFVNEQTITYASVEYDSEQGYYTVKLTLDVNNSLTTQKSINAIRNGTGDKKAKFKLIEMEFEVWDNGYFKSLNIKEEWSAKVFFSIGSQFNNNYYFSYSKGDANLMEYKDSKDMIEAIK